MFVQVFQVILQDPIRGIFLLQEQTFLGISGFLDFSSSAAQAGIPHTHRAFHIWIVCPVQAFPRVSPAANSSSTLQELVCTAQLWVFGSRCPECSPGWVVPVPSCWHCSCIQNPVFQAFSLLPACLLGRGHCGAGVCVAVL